MKTPHLDEEIKRLESFKNPIYEHVKQLKEYKAIKEALSIHDGINNQILQDLLKEQEEVIMSPIRFNGVHVEKIKQVFKKYGVEFEQQF